MRNRIILSFLVCFWIGQTIVATRSHAIPAFARRYKISCSTCHAPFPRLKDYGEEFAGNGMILKEEEKARDYVSAGDDLLWLNKTFPIGVRFDAYALYDQDKTVENDLQSPWGLKLLSGGTLYKNIGYYFYFYMSERGEVAGIEDAYVHFDNIFGSNLDIMLGQFQTSDPLMKRELRLTFHDYMIYKQRIGSSQTNLAYDRGIMLVYGIEKTGTDIVALIVNGNGKAEAVNQKFDSDKYKNYGLRISQSVFGLFSIGGYYYKGKEGTQGDNLNEIAYWGPDFNIGVGPINVTAQYLERKDTNPWFSNPNEITTKGMVIEATILPQLDQSRVVFTALYNDIRYEAERLTFLSEELTDYQAMTLSATYLVARNCRLIAEYTRDMEFDKNRFVLGLVSGF